MYYNDNTKFLFRRKEQIIAAFKALIIELTKVAENKYSVFVTIGIPFSGIYFVNE